MLARHLVVAGIISSVGLTVSLFIAGEAFAKRPTLEAQAKMGALFSAAPCVVLCVATVSSEDFRAYNKGGAAKRDADLELGADQDRSDAESQSSHHTDGASEHGSHVLAEVQEEDEDLEAVVVNNIEASLLRIQRLETKIEARIGMSRSKSIDHFHLLERERSRRSFDTNEQPPSPRSPRRPPTPPPTPTDVQRPL